MPIVPIILTVVVTASALALALYGERTVAGDAAAAVRLARQIFGAAVATASRQSRDHGTVTVTVDPPRGAHQPHRQSIVVLAAPGVTFSRPIQVIESQPGQPLSINFSLNTSSADKVDVAISVYDAPTLAPLARLNVTVPPSQSGATIYQALMNALEWTTGTRSDK